jgi:hypothetical protein
MYLIHPSGQLLRFSGWQKAGGTCVACKLSRNIEINLAEVPGGGNFRFKFSKMYIMLSSALHNKCRLLDTYISTENRGKKPLLRGLLA